MKKQRKILKFNVIFEQEDDGGYCVQAPALPGCFSQGDTFEEALNNIKEAIKLYLEDEAKEEVSYLSQRVEREFIVPVRLPQYA